jgi:hypothetical protein
MGDGKIAAMRARDSVRMGLVKSLGVANKSEDRPAGIPMPNFGAKISSAYITANVMREFIDQLPFQMRGLFGDHNLTAYYGWLSNLHADLWYKPMSVPLDVFPYFIEDSISHGIYDIGVSDLLIHSPDSTVRILLCHEFDVHIDGTNDDAIAKLVSSFPHLDFRSANDWKSHYDDQSKIEGGGEPGAAATS